MSPKPRGPRRRPDFRNPLRKSDDDKVQDQLSSPSSEGLAARLAEILGTGLDEVDFSTDHLTAWNQTVDESNRAGFEHRVLLGIAINRRRPEYGRVVDYQDSIAESLGRSTRWVQATMSVSATVDSAFQEGIVLPLELCDVSWYAIPSAVNNIRHGRPLDWKPDKPRQLTPEQQEAAVAKAYRALDKALDAVEDPARRAALAQSLIEKLGGHAEADESDPRDPGRQLEGTDAGEGFTPSRPHQGPPPPRRPGRRPHRWRS